MTDFRDKLPPDLRAKQRTLVHNHNIRIMLTWVGFCSLAFVALQVLRPYPRAALTVAIVALILMVYVALVFIPKADARQCQRIGFTCPSCGKPLYDQSSIHGHKSSLITRGVCPHCDHSLVTTITV